MLPQIEALAAFGCDVHVGLGGRAARAAAELVELCRRHPKISIGHAVGRSDSWSRLADTLRQAAAEPGASRLSPKSAASMAAALPADPGVLAYLRQLDLDLVLLAGDAGPLTLTAEYLRACTALGLPCQPLAATPEEALVQAAQSRLSPAPDRRLSRLAWRPVLWAMLAWDAVTLPAEEEAVAGAQGPDQQAGLGARMAEAYARSVFPVLGGFGARLGPAGRPLLKARLERELDPVRLANEMSAEAVMARAAQGQGPVVLGPWTGDPDLELLYWVPFLRWWRRRYRVDKERIIAVSTGEASFWYAGLGTYLDLQELFEADALNALEQDRREELARRGKQFGATDADRQVFRRLDRRLGFRGFSVLPPWVMHVLFERYWSGEAGPAFLAERTRSQAFAIKDKRARQLFPELAPGYLAMSFEGASDLPDTDETRAFAVALIQDAARHGPVAVICSAGRGGALRAAAGGIRGVHWMELDPRTARAAGTTLAACAAGFVGAQTWLAYAASAAGKPVLCLQSGPDPRQFAHRAAAAFAFQAPLLALGVGQPETFGRALQWMAAARDGKSVADAVAAH